MNIKKSWRSAIIALGCCNILTLPLYAGDGVGTSPTNVTVDTRDPWLNTGRELVVTLHQVDDRVIKNNSAAAGIDTPLEVNGTDRSALSGLKQLGGSGFGRGLVADGVTPLVFRVVPSGTLTGPVTYEATLKLEDSIQWKSPPPDLGRRLRVLDGVTVQSKGTFTLTPQQPEAYLVLDAIRSCEISDNRLGEAYVTLTVKRQNAPWWWTPAVDPHFAIRKPPVVLVHGYNSNHSAWEDSFKKTLVDDRGGDFVVAVDYGTSGKDNENTDGNTYGDFVTLTETLRQSLTKQVESRTGSALWPADRWAWTRYDAVGHSQGGVLLRLLCSASTTTSCLAYPFRSPDNQYRGRFNRVITVGSPHFGSTLGHLGSLLLDAHIPFGDKVIEENFKDADKRKLLQPKFRIDGGVCGNPTPRILNQLYVPDQAAKIHLLGATIYGGEAPGPDPDLPGIYKALYLDRSGTWGSSVAPYGADGVVDLRSQLARTSGEMDHPLRTNSSRMPANENITHAGIEWYKESWAHVFRTFAFETNETSVATRVRDLLNGSADSFGPFPTAAQCAALHAEMDDTVNAIDGILKQISDTRKLLPDRLYEQVSNPPAPHPNRVGPLGPQGPIPEKSPSSIPETVNMALQPPEGESPNGAVVWSVVVYGPNGITTDGVTLTQTGTYGENLKIDLAASVVGEVVVSVQFPSASGMTVIGKPGVVVSRPPGTLTGIEVRPDTLELSAGPAIPLEVWGLYDDSSKVLLFTDTDNTTYASDNPAVATVDAEGLVTLVVPGTTAVRTTYNGSLTAAAAIHVLTPAPVITSPLVSAGSAGHTYSYQIAVDGAPVAFSADGLPSGLAVNSATGLVSGSPTLEGLFHFTVAAANADGQEGFRQVELTVTGTNQAPTAIGLDNSSVPALQAVGTMVGNLATADANPLDTFTYQLSSGEGDTDNALFSISGGVLLTTASIDPATTPQCSIRLRSTDNGGLSVEQALVLPVLGAPVITDPPTDMIVFSGRSFVLEVDATGREPLAFQWQQGGVDIPGATSKTLERAAGLPGSMAFTVRVSNALGQVTSVAANVTVSLMSFDAWAATYTVPGGAAILPGDDPNHDGFNNLLEFALNINPLLPGVGGRPFASVLHEIGGDVLSLTHRRLIGGSLGFDYEWSPDLSYWTPFTPTLDVPNPDVDGDGTTELIRASRPIGPDEPAGFLRLKVSEP